MRHALQPGGTCRSQSQDVLVFQYETGECVYTVESQFAADVVTVIFNRAIAYPQFFGDFLAGQRLADPLQNSLFHSGEIVQIGTQLPFIRSCLCEAFGGLGVEIFLPAENGFQAAFNFLRSRLFGR